MGADAMMRGVGGCGKRRGILKTSANEKKVMVKNNTTKGLTLLFTGNGKGKTTAALGMALRGLGHGHRVCIIQFIKGSWHYGELDAAKRFQDLLDVYVMGRGFTWKSDDLEKDTALAREGWEHARRVLAGGEYQTVILDELTYLISYEMIKEQEVIEAIKGRPPQTHLVITGRNASRALQDACDLVTEMREIKHPYRQGVKAQKGIEF
jgi:cob(I)alamin adenosyltransferase